MTNTPLRADCARCAALCCVALGFETSSLFAFRKRAHCVCPHLTADDRCGIHASREAAGMGGCVRYDCLGAGQVVTALFSASWREEPAMLEVFDKVRALHELIELLVTAEQLPLDAEGEHTRGELLRGLDRRGGWSLETLADLDLPEKTRLVHGFLRSLSGSVAGTG